MVMRTAWIRLVVPDLVILCAWFATIGMVVWQGHGGSWAGRPAVTLTATLESKEQWFGVYYHDQKMGFSNLVLTPEERHGVPGVGLLDRGRLRFTLLGAPQELEIVTRAFIDADWRLQEFSAAVRSPTQELRWVGQREGDELVVSVSSSQGLVTKRLRDPTGNAFVNGLSSWVAFHSLREGQSGQAWVLNPLALNPEPVYFHVRGRESINGTEALVVESDVSGMTTTSWVTPQGEVLKETSPLGWELRREPQQQALEHPTTWAAQLDLLSATAVPVEGAIDQPDHVERAVLLIEGLSAKDVTLERPWQTVLPSERLTAFQPSAPAQPWCLVQLDRPRVPTTTGAARVGARYTQPSPFVQSDDPRIRAKAADIVGTQAAPPEQMEAISAWVFQTVAKRFTIGLPSAVDVLATPSGDCHEHTVLFTALARSAGLSTRMVAGLVYQSGRLFYHAWPEVWLGAWVPTDPTLGQPVADALHLGLVEAENEQLIALGKFVGRLRVTILTVQAGATGP